MGKVLPKIGVHSTLRLTVLALRYNDIYSSSLNFHLKI